MPSSAGKCHQVESLFPRHTFDALAEMDEFVLSDKFLNETVARMAGAIRIPSESLLMTWARVGAGPTMDVMYDVAAYLERIVPARPRLAPPGQDQYPRLVLYTRQGSDPSLKPTVLMAHQDVVPAAESTAGQWTHPPYGGVYDGKYIWGRGAMDCKNTLDRDHGGRGAAARCWVRAAADARAVVWLRRGDLRSPGAGHLAPAILERYGQGRRGRRRRG